MADKIERAELGTALLRRFVEVRSGEFAPEVVALGPGGSSDVGLTDAELRATPVAVDTDGLTDAQLRATPVPVSGTVTASGPLTDTQLRASSVPVDSELPAAAALADAAANPTVPTVGADLSVHNGATWDRLRAVSAVGEGLGVAHAMQPSSTPAHTTAASNNAVVRTYAAVAGQRHRLTGLSCSWSGVGPTVGLLTVEDGSGTTVFAIDVTTSLNTPQHVPLPPGGILGSVNTEMIVTLAAGGTGSVGKLNTAKLTG